MLTPDQVEALLNEPIYSWDSLTLLGDVEDFLDFSEANIERQARRELRATALECDRVEFEDPLDTARYREQRIEGVQYRFKTSLTQRVRYSGLTAVITTLEWSLIVMKGRASFPIPKTPKKTNEAVHLLTVFAETSRQDRASEIEELKLLTQVRNCIVHSAGRSDTYEFAVELRQALAGHASIKLSTASYLGECIEIGRGFLQAVVKRAERWLPALEKEMHLQGLLR